MPPDIRLRCRVLIYAAITWQLFIIYCPSKVRVDMHEVLTESDLTIFVCPCGSQFGEELNFYFHVRQVHKEPVFIVLSGMNGKNPQMPHAYPVDSHLDAYGPPVIPTYLPILGSEGAILSRMRKLFQFKNELPRVHAKYLAGDLSTKQRLPKWQEMKRQALLQSSSSTSAPGTNEANSQANDDSNSTL